MPSLFSDWNFSFDIYFEIGWNLNVYHKIYNLEVKMAGTALIRTIYCPFSLTSHTEFTLWYMWYSSSGPSNRGHRRDIVLKQNSLLKMVWLKWSVVYVFYWCIPINCIKILKKIHSRYLLYSKWIEFQDH